MTEGHKNVVFINQYFYPFQTATAQLLEELTEYLAQNDIKITVVTGTNGEKELLKRENRNGVAIIRIPNTSDGHKFIRKLLSYLTFLYSLRKSIKRLENDSIIVAFSTPPLNGVIPKRYKKKKGFFLILNNQDLYPDLLVALHKIRSNSLLYRLLWKITKRLYDHSDRIIVVGRKMKEKIIEDYALNPGKIQVIENWALRELENVGRDTEAGKTGDNHLRILYTGNMGRSHEHETLFNGMKRLSEIEGIELLIIGGGYNYELFKKAVKNESLKNVSFGEYVARSELHRLIDSANLCVVIGNKELCGHIVPSKFYGYLSRGKPVLYINSGEDEISHHLEAGRFGFQIPNNGVEDFYQVIKSVVDKREILSEMSRNAATYYSTNLRRDYRLKEYLDVIKETEATFAK
ncbi:MAG TPA: glycosyltransferase family 4 protein [Thermotogota bacterium]|nr:glycosyltransferase family 4 protein [Thermotogota bacterium]